MNTTSTKLFSSLDSDIICCHKNDILPKYEDIPFHNHDGYEIYLFLSGDADYYIESCGKHLERGDLILMSPFSFHCVKSNSESIYERIFININEQTLNDISSKSIDLSECFIPHSKDIINLMHLDEDEIDKFINLADQLQDSLVNNAYASVLLANSLLTQIMIFINRKSQENEIIPYVGIMPDLVMKLIRFINEHISDNITVKTIAELFHHNPDYLSRSFKLITGISLQHFILTKKISLA